MSAPIRALRPDVALHAGYYASMARSAWISIFSSNCLKLRSTSSIATTIWLIRYWKSLCRTLRTKLRCCVTSCLLMTSNPNGGL